jgi:hypothetical protein
VNVQGLAGVLERSSRVGRGMCRRVPQVARRERRHRRLSQVRLRTSNRNPAAWGPFACRRPDFAHLPAAAIWPSADTSAMGQRPYPGPSQHDGEWRASWTRRMTAPPLESIRTCPGCSGDIHPTHVFIVTRGTPAAKHPRSSVGNFASIPARRSTFFWRSDSTAAELPAETMAAGENARRLPACQPAALNWSPRAR